MLNLPIKGWKVRCCNININIVFDCEIAAVHFSKKDNDEGPESREEEKEAVAAAANDVAAPVILSIANP